MIKAIGRFFVRLWHMNRNQLLTQAFKIIVKELDKRKAVLIHIPEDRRDELIGNDYILKHSVAIHNTVKGCLEGIQRVK